MGTCNMYSLRCIMIERGLKAGPHSTTANCSSVKLFNLFKTLVRLRALQAESNIAYKFDSVVGAIIMNNGTHRKKSALKSFCLVIKRVHSVKIASLYL